MARGPYNKTCDLIYGSSGLHPGMVYKTLPCRLVEESYEDIFNLPWSQRVAYVTMDDVPNVASVSSAGYVFSSDFAFADLIAVPSGSPANYQVLFVEVVSYKSQPAYSRVHVRSYP